MFARLVVMAVVLLATVTASANTIVATASGSATPELSPTPFFNGDFFIAGPIAPYGNGEDENNTWALDFNGDPGWPLFSATSVLESALISLSLHTTGSVFTDALSIEGLDPIYDPFSTLSGGLDIVVEFDLLDFYTSTEVIGILFGGDPGHIPFFYADDAILSEVRLELVAIPEPSTLVLVFAGLVALSSLRSWPI